MFFSTSKPDFMQSVRGNNIDDLIGASIEGVTLDEFKDALRLLEDANPDWKTRSVSDLTRAYITGLGNKIKALQEQSSSVAPK